MFKAGIIAVLVVAVGGGSLAYAFYDKLNGNIKTADVTSALGDDRPAQSPPGAVNIALIGSDSRAGTGGAYGKALGSEHSDTLMVLHLSADHKWATAVSLPRDSWVDIPSCDLGGGKTSAPTKAKINSAFAVGGSRGGGAAGGAACTIKTVEQNTGLRIDHFLEIDFSGFSNMVNALGGVQMCLPKAIKDTKASLSLPAGCQKLDGKQALGFARARYALGDGSDIGRIGRQQELLAAMLATVQDKKLDAPAMYRLADAATKSLTVDSKLGGLSGLLGLAKDFQAMPKGGLTFVTVPNYPRELDVPSDKANVVWKTASKDLFTALRDDKPVDKDGRPLSASDDSPEPARSGALKRKDIKVTVLNGTDVTGKATGISRKVAADGFRSGATGNAARREPVTVIRYGQGGEQAARTLADALGLDTSRLRQEGGAAASSVTLIIGADYASAGL
ncbi:LCP family protein [Streptomyces sp. H27-H1]|uniref:LCP family protein n=1 Tax=Streptomyces sp. H27-H1 TaxID=2996461 RepID=UPI0022722DD0|nr:LCP family protein [Streptomyces sp. H27-H1]MCY0931635.1 LCP family protein [Streptomyces sp. H27-H1]